MRYLIFLATLNCATIPLSKSDTVNPFTVDQHSAADTFITVYFQENPHHPFNISVASVSNGFTQRQCSFSAYEPEDPTQNPKFNLIMRRMYIKAKLLDELVSMSKFDSARKFHVIIKKGEMSSSWFRPWYGYIHMMTLGFLPYFEATTNDLEYLTIQQGEQIHVSTSQFRLSTLSWTPVVLGGYTSNLDQVYAENWLKFCESFRAPFAK